jgi:hypothetical protein
MNDISQKSKDRGASSSKGQAAKPGAKEEEIEPCDKPQAQEALRLRTSDDACDDGVE